MKSVEASLPATLQQARKSRRLSQLELSLRMGVSQRHVSFVESGRAKPSRSLLLAWLQELEAPLSLRNAALLQAGYAPAYSATPLNDPALAHANDALVQLLSAHDPMPAMVLDADWNVLYRNRGAQWLTATLMPWAAKTLGDHASVNMLDLLVHPEGICKSVVNFAEVGPTLLAHLRHSETVRPALKAKVDNFAGILRDRIGANVALNPWPQAAAPVLTTRFATSHGELAFFSMFTTFGTPQDITLASLRVEHLFAADEATRNVLRKLVV